MTLDLVFSVPELSGHDHMVHETDHLDVLSAAHLLVAAATAEGHLRRTVVLLLLLLLIHQHLPLLDGLQLVVSDLKTEEQILL